MPSLAAVISISSALAGCGLTLDFGARQDTNERDTGTNRRDGGVLPADAAADASDFDPATCVLAALPRDAPSPAAGGVDLARKPGGLLGARYTAGNAVVAEEFAGGFVGSSVGEVTPFTDPDRAVVAVSSPDFVLATLSWTPGELVLRAPGGMLGYASMLRAFDVTGTADPTRPFAAVVVESPMSAHLARVSPMGTLVDREDLSGSFVDAAIALAPSGALHVALVGAPVPETADVELLEVAADGTVVRSRVETIAPRTDAVEATVRIVHAGPDVYVLYAFEDEDPLPEYRLTRMEAGPAGTFAPGTSVSITTPVIAAASHPAFDDYIALVYATPGGLLFELRSRFDLGSVGNMPLVEGLDADSVALESDPSGHALFVALAVNDVPLSAQYIEFVCR